MILQSGITKGVSLSIGTSRHRHEVTERLLTIAFKLISNKQINKHRRMQLPHDCIACGLQETYQTGQAVFLSVDCVNTTCSFLTHFCRVDPSTLTLRTGQFLIEGLSC